MRQKGEKRERREVPQLIVRKTGRGSERKYESCGRFSSIKNRGVSEGEKRVGTKDVARDSGGDWETWRKRGGVKKTISHRRHSISLVREQRRRSGLGKRGLW